jgi:hypothetical protein
MLKFRFATPEDAPLLAKWGVENPDIPVKDLKAVAASPSSVALIVSDDDKILLILPWYVSLTVGYFGFNPDATPKERLTALNAALPIVEAAAKQFFIAHIEGWSNEHYNIAKWAEHNGFIQETRQAFIKTLPRETVN